MTEAVTLEEASQTRPKTAGVRTSSGISKKEKHGDAPKDHLRNPVKGYWNENTEEKTPGDVKTQLQSQVEKRETSKMKEREMEETQKYIQHLEHESKHLKSLLSNLHKYVTTNRDANDSSFEVPSEMQTDSTLIAESQQAVKIFQKIKEMEGINLRLEEKEKESIDYKQQQAEKMAAYNEELSKLNLQSKKQRQHISDLQQKKDELLNRFSKLAGDRLKHENTNITDLSDADRPTKLSEAFSELYDNVWTDAFEELTLGHRFQDKDAIKSLLDILMTSFQKCREITWDRYQTLKTVASTIDVVERVLPCVRTVPECEPESQSSLSKSGVNSKKPEHQNPPSQPESTNIKEEAREVTETNHQKECDTSEHQTRYEATEEALLQSKEERKHNRKRTEHEEAREVTEQNHQKDCDTSEDRKRDVITEQLEPKDVKETPKVAKKEHSEDVIREEVATQLEAIQPSNGNGPGDREETETNVNHTAICTTNISKELEPLHKRDEEEELSPQSKVDIKILNLTCAIALTEDQEAEIKNIWRATTIALKNKSVKHIYTLLLTSFDILSKDVPKTFMYLNNCIDLCWKMCVQEKPMHLDTYAERDDGYEKTFNLDKFKAYTKSGKGVAFVVWPALFLHEGGAMMNKGVAQGCDESDKGKNTVSE